jgi:hypothetical protein
MLEEPEITTMSEKGQVVIPQEIRKHLKLKARTKFSLREGPHHNNEEDPAPGHQERLEQDIQNGGQEGPENI